MVQTLTTVLLTYVQRPSMADCLQRHYTPSISFLEMMEAQRFMYDISYQSFSIMFGTLTTLGNGLYIYIQELKMLIGR